MGDSCRPFDIDLLVSFNERGQRRFRPRVWPGVSRERAGERRANATDKHGTLADKIRCLCFEATLQLDLEASATHRMLPLI